MSSPYIQQYSELIANDHDAYSDLFRAAARFDTILAAFGRLRTSEAHMQFAKAVLDDYERFADRLRALLLDYSDGFYKGLKREKRERRQRIFENAFKCSLSGAFYSKNTLIQGSSRDVLSCSEPMDAEQAEAIVQRAFADRIGVEYRMAEDLQARDFYSVELGLELAQSAAPEPLLVEKLKAKGIEVAADYNLSEIVWSHFPETESAVAAVCRKEYTEQLAQICDKYDESTSLGSNQAYVMHTAFLAYALRFKGWELTFGPDNQIQLLHDSQLVQEYM